MIGDLTRPEPLHYWSEITLVTWGLSRQRHELYRALDELASEPEIILREVERATLHQQEELRSEAVEV